MCWSSLPWAAGTVTDHYYRVGAVLVPSSGPCSKGDQETGVGIMAMEEGLDTGPVLLEQRTPIQLLEPSIALAERLSALTAELMVQAMPLIEAAGPGPEDERLARLNVRVQAEGSTYARMLEKQDFQLDWSAPALSIHRKVMGASSRSVHPVAGQTPEGVAHGAVDRAPAGSTQS